MSAVVAVFGSSSLLPTDRWWGAAERLGRRLAQAGLTVATGGYGGTMEAVSRGAADAGGHVVGVTAPTVFPERQGPNGYLSEEVVAASITERIHLLVSMADAAITLPGSIGTLAEFMVAWNRAFVARFSGEQPLLHVAVGGQWPALVEYLGRVFAVDPSPVRCLPDVDQAAEVVISQLREIPGLPQVARYPQNQDEPATGPLPAP